MFLNKMNILSSRKILGNPKKPAFDPPVKSRCLEKPNYICKTHIILKSEIDLRTIWVLRIMNTALRILIRKAYNKIGVSIKQ